MSQTESQSDSIDIGSRHISPWSTKAKIGRLLWWIVQATLFRWSFHNMYQWRRFLLTCFGAKIGKTSRIRSSVRIECPWMLDIGEHCAIGDRVILYALGKITLGDRVTISQGSHLCAGSHDYSKPDFPLLRPPIHIENDVWIAADAFVGPNVTAHQGAILGARACAFKNLEASTIYSGNPAQPIKKRTLEQK